MSVDDQSLPETGACWNCGLLCHHQKKSSAYVSVYREVTVESREEHRYVQWHPDSACVHIPWCFRMILIDHELDEGAESASITLPASEEEWRDHLVNDTETAQQINQVAWEVISRNRSCERWYRYQPGNSPEKHLDEWRLDRQERDRREWERELEASRRAFEQDLQAENDRMHRREWGVDAALGLLAVVLAALQILTADPDSYLARTWFPFLGSPPTATAVAPATLAPDAEQAQP